MMSVEVLRAWFAAHASGDLDAARRLLVEGAPVRLPDGGRVHGFDEVMAWYEARVRDEGPSFAYEVLDLLGGDAHAAAVIRLTTTTSSRRQVALYGVEGDRIRSIALYEDEP